jgi:hypothetical protein
MKLLYKVNFFNEDARLSVISSGLNVIEDSPYTSYTCDSESECFSKIMRLTKGSSGSRYWPIWEFSKRELDQTYFFLIRAKKLFYEKDNDFKRNEAQLQEKITKNGDRVFVLRNTRLVNLRVKDTEILYDDSFEEVYTTVNFYEKLKKEGILGVEKHKILKNDDGDFYKEYIKLQASNIFPPVYENELLIKSKNGNRYNYFCYGNLAYNVDFKEIGLDLYRTNEPLGANDMALLLCSKKMRDCIKQNKIIGLRFEPVLEVNSVKYQEYINLWKSSFAKIKENPNNQIC